MTDYPDFLASEQSPATAAEALFHVIPAPLEQSVSYGTGTAGGPQAILEASQQLEAWDGTSEPLELGIHTSGSIDCSGSIETTLAMIRKRTEAVLSENKIPVLLGGEHTVTLGALQAACRVCRDPVGLFQLDAHADLRDSYEGSTLSHACVARRAHQDLKLPLYQFGVRALCREEVAYRASENISYCDARQWHANNIASLELPTDFPDKIYLSLDVDGLDPAVIRATGTPVPGGPGWHDTLRALEKVITGRTVVGFDIVELAPRPDDQASTFAAAQLTYCVMGLIQRCSRLTQIARKNSAS